MAVVLTLVQTKQIRINIHKRNNRKNTVQTVQNTVSTSTHSQYKLYLLSVLCNQRRILQARTTDYEGYVIFASWRVLHIHNEGTIQHQQMAR